MAHQKPCAGEMYMIYRETLVKSQCIFIYLIHIHTKTVVGR